nr:PREDICTED: transcription initiation factor IIA subunit 1 isoform X1 [Bemisia tabaci]
MTLSQTSVLKLYTSVIEDVISGVRDAFVDDGIDEQVLQELKQIWETKLVSSKAVELNPDPEPQPPPQTSTIKTEVTRNVAPQPKPGNHVVVDQSQQQQPLSQPGSMSQTQFLGGTMQQAGVVQQTSQQPVQPQQQQQSASQVDLTNKLIPLQITVPTQGGSRILTIEVPASALQDNMLAQILTGPVISTTISLPPHLASSVLQQHVNAVLQGQAASGIVQLSQNALAQAGLTNGSDSGTATRSNFQQVDGANDTSDDDEDGDDDVDDDDDDDLEDKDDEEGDDEGGAEEEPLNSGDDVSEEDPNELFDTDNVVVCQYDKISRSRNKWKFQFKDGIMNLSGKDYVFQRANGDAEW